MLTALRAKANQHADVKKTLIDSVTPALVEQSPKDNFWGNGPGRKRPELPSAG